MLNYGPRACQEITCRFLISGRKMTQLQQFIMFYSIRVCKAGLLRDEFVNIGTSLLERK